MAIEATDLMPGQFKVTVQGKEYTCNPPRMAHRLILMKVQPLFQAIAKAANGELIDIDSEKILSYQHDLDVLFGDLIPEFKNVTLDDDSLVSIIEQMLDNSMPAESKKLREAKVEVNNDPKVEMTG